MLDNKAIRLKGYNCPTIYRIDLQKRHFFAFNDAFVIGINWLSFKSPTTLHNYTETQKLEFRQLLDRVFHWLQSQYIIIPDSVIQVSVHN